MSSILQATHTIRRTGKPESTYIVHDNHIILRLHICVTQFLDWLHNLKIAQILRLHGTFVMSQKSLSKRRI